MPDCDNAELWERTDPRGARCAPHANRRLIVRGASVCDRRVGPRVAEGSESGLLADDRGEGVQEVTGRRASPVEPRHRHHVTGAPMRPASAGPKTYRR